MKRWYRRAAAWGAASGVVMAGAVAWYGSQQHLPEGVAVSDWNAGGIRTEAFAAALNRQAARLGEKKITMRAALPGGTTVERTATLGELGLTTNAAALAGETEQLLSGPFWERARTRWSWRGRELALEAGISPDTLAAALRKLWPELYAGRPVDARRVIAAGDQVRYVPGVAVSRPDEQGLRAALLALIAAAGGGGGEDSDGGEGDGGQGDGSPTGNRPATSEPGRVSVPEALRPDGPLLSPEPLSVEIPLYEWKPAVTVESLRAQGIERLIASFGTSFRTSGAGRQHNVTSTAAVIHDRLLEPGGIFDYEKIIRETEAKFGYREAPVILNGKLVPGIGGGICQVSTTLYNAALRAGLDIVERRNHSLPVGYAPLGQDATFASGHINFKFRNSTDKYILIRTSSEGSKLTVKLFGTMDPAVSYDIKSVTLETIAPAKKYVKNPSLKEGSVELLQRGKPGYVVETYRYKKVNGNIVGKERISKDTYKAQPALYASNSGDGSERETKFPELPKEHIIEDGVMAPMFEPAPPPRQ